MALADEGAAAFSDEFVPDVAAGVPRGLNPTAPRARAAPTAATASEASLECWKFMSELTIRIVLGACGSPYCTRGPMLSCDVVGLGSAAAPLLLAAVPLLGPLTLVAIA